MENNLLKKFVYTRKYMKYYEKLLNSVHKIQKVEFYFQKSVQPCFHTFHWQKETFAKLLSKAF